MFQSVPPGGGSIGATANNASSYTGYAKSEARLPASFSRTVATQRLDMPPILEGSSESAAGGGSADADANAAESVSKKVPPPIPQAIPLKPADARFANADAEDVHAYLRQGRASAR